MSAPRGTSESLLTAIVVAAAGTLAWVAVMTADLARQVLGRDRTDQRP
jgi:ABC-type Fe3+-siderophore transport system permease subunit